MKKQSTKKLLPVSIGLCLLGFIGYVLACGGDSYDETEYKFLSPEVSHADQYSPFFRSIHQYYQYGQPNNVVDFNVANVTEWNDFFYGKVTPANLDYLLYQTRAGEIDTLLLYCQNFPCKISETLLKNTIHLISNKNMVKEFLSYLGFAKRCEVYATYQEDWTWSTTRSELVKKEDPRKQSTTIYTLIEIGKRQMKNTKSPFVIQRYLFQLIRLYYNAGLYADGYQYYLEHLNSIAIPNSIKFRLMEYAGGALYRMRRYSEANYLFSVVFDQYDGLKQSTFLDFHPQEENDWQQSLLLAKNVREKTVLWLLLGLSRDPFRAAQEIYRLDTKSDLLDPLIVQLISMEEEKFIPRPYDEMYVNYRASPEKSSTRDEPFVLISDNLHPELVEFVCEVARKENTHKPYLWNISAGYLRLVQHKFTEADVFFTKADNQARNDTLVNEQLKLLRIISKVEQTQIPDKKFEATIVKDLLWLKDKHHQQALRNNEAYQWLLKKLSSLYALNNEQEKSIFLTPGYQRSFYNDTANIMKLVNFMNKPRKSEFDNYLLAIFPYHKSDLYEIMAVKLMYQGKPKEALAMLVKCEGSGNRELFGDPFQSSINDCNECNYSLYGDTSYNKLSFIEEMASIDDKVKQYPEYAPDYYWTMANGYYNMSYFGSAREMFQTCVRGYHFIDFKWKYRDNYFEKDDPILDCSLAEKYYCKAMEVSKDREFKAECCFLAAKCEQNRFFARELSDYKGDFKSGTYFRKLQSDFSDTKYYQEVLQECGYFATFVNKKNKRQRDR